eukprot:SAG31_NODE_11888_length_988_cov_1.389201_1_plen_203_part_01
MRTLLESVVAMDPEAEKVKKLVSQPLREGDPWYLISQKWWDRWAGFTGYNPNALGGGSKPEPIDSTELLHDAVSKKDMAILRPDLREYVDYAMVPEPVWQYLHEKYGGGPIFRRLGVMRGYDVIIERYPLIITAVSISLDGEVSGDGVVHTLSRESPFSAAVDLILATATMDTATLWVNRNAQNTEISEVMVPAILRGYERIE